MKKIMDERRREKEEEKRAKLVVAVFVMKKQNLSPFHVRNYFCDSIALLIVAY